MAIPASLFRALTWAYRLIAISVIGLALTFAYREALTSERSAHYFHAIATQSSSTMADGRSDSISFPEAAPYDFRFGYAQLPSFTRVLAEHDFQIVRQARMSAAMRSSPLHPIFPEKDRAGLTLYDAKATVLADFKSPQHTYGRFEDIPAIIAATLVFIEDRQLLTPPAPSTNPAINWSRMLRAIGDQLAHRIDASHEAPGASTIVTQIEKYRHSPDGRTSSPGEKLQQMQNASLRVYRDGVDTTQARRQAVVTYLNTVPLTARERIGEINGLGDGMLAWYGRTFDDVNRLLAPGQTGGTHVSPESAQLYKEVLSLIIAQRRPSFFLHEGYPQLQRLVEQHLHVLVQAGIISRQLEAAAMRLPLKTVPAPSVGNTDFVDRKGINSTRSELAGILHLAHLYQLDRLDVEARSTLDGPLQADVSRVLRDLKYPESARRADLYGKNMLAPNDDPSHITYSFTLYERSQGANLLRVQTDNLDQPLDINNGARLNLGSTAKLRTLITYLEVMSSLHASLAQQVSTPDSAHADAPQTPVLLARDALTVWAMDYMRQHPDCTLRDFLEASMLRTYSGNPAEVFFTGGGEQQFENFDASENGRMMTVREGFQHSVNLVFVRMMRDLVHYFGSHTNDAKLQDLANLDDDTRKVWLAKFADKEGREFTSRFFHKFSGRKVDEIEQSVYEALHTSPRRRFIAFLSMHPEATLAEARKFVEHDTPDQPGRDAIVENWYRQFHPDHMSMSDRGFLAGMHPLELWTATYLRSHPHASQSEVMQAGVSVRQEVYEWLFKTHNRKVQDSRIAQMLELAAFQEIAKTWRRLGYPFEILTPSLGTALGASGDRPASLAFLMGLIINDGQLLPTHKLTHLRFAAGTPYETEFAVKPTPSQPVFSPDIAAIVKRSLSDVVQGGTAIRMKAGISMPDGSVLAVGGKTGTGDHRYEKYSASGDLIEVRAINRSATFVFLIGDRYFGTMTAYAHEPYAAQYGFTSALSVQLLKSLTPALQHLAATRAP